MLTYCVTAAPGAAQTLRRGFASVSPGHITEIASISGKLRKAKAFDVKVVALVVVLRLAGPRSLVLSDSQVVIRVVYKRDSPSS